MFRPQGARFAFVHFEEDASAAAALGPQGLRTVDGRPVRVQAAKQACAELTAWRQALLGQRGAATDVGC